MLRYGQWRLNMENKTIEEFEKEISKLKSVLPFMIKIKNL